MEVVHTEDPTECSVYIVEDEQILHIQEDAQDLTIEEKS